MRIMFKGWEYFGMGNYNIVYVNPNKSEVLKIQRISDSSADPSNESEGSKIQRIARALDVPIRSVRIWNTINSEVTPLARIYEYKETVGWVCPFIEGRQANDKEMRTAVIDIFNSSGRILIDGTATKNFITTPSGQVICVDIGMALQLEKREYLINGSRRSFSSLDAWKLMEPGYQDFFQTNGKIYPHTIATTKALLFIKNMRPDILDLTFLKEDLTLTKLLAKAYDVQYQHDASRDEVIAATERLGRDYPETIEGIKKSCKHLLENYIHSRGTLDISGVFSPSIVTKLLRNQNLIQIKIVLILLPN